MKKIIYLLMILNIISCKTKEKINQDATITVEKLIECIKNNEKEKFMELQYFSKDDVFGDFESLQLSYQNSLIKDKKLKINLKDTIDNVFGKLKYVKIPYWVNDNPLIKRKYCRSWYIYFDEKKGFDKINSYNVYDENELPYEYYQKQKASQNLK